MGPFLMPYTCYILLQFISCELARFFVYYSMIRSDNNKKGVNSMIELTCKICDDVTIKCDEDTVAVTCSMCSMVDVGCI